MEFSRVTIFTGNYGSGKTELSINYALLLAESITGIMLVDLDVVNPYFRSREKAQFLSEKGIEVIYPRGLLQADLPIVPADVQRLIQNRERYGVIDVGGDESGATALGSVSRRLTAADYEMNMVVNTRRVFTSSIEGIIGLKERIEERSRLRVDNLICNVNLGGETSSEIIREGFLLVREAARQLDLPIKFIAIRKELLPVDFDPGVEIFPVEIFMKPPWIR